MIDPDARKINERLAAHWRAIGKLEERIDRIEWLWAQVAMGVDPTQALERLERGRVKIDPVKIVPPGEVP